MKNLLMMILLAGAMFIAWWWLSSHREAESPGGTGGRIAPFGIGSAPKPDADEELLLALEGATAALLGPLEGGEAAVKSLLQDIWNRSRSRFHSGDLAQEPARITAALMQRLGELDTERERFRTRLAESAAPRRSSLQTDPADAARAQQFAREAVMRQWEEWVTLHRKEISDTTRRLRQELSL